MISEHFIEKCWIVRPRHRRGFIGVTRPTSSLGGRGAAVGLVTAQVPPTRPDQQTRSPGICRSLKCVACKYKADNTSTSLGVHAAASHTTHNKVNMDHESLRTASTYLNNLLLARGLLRDGEPIDFVKPSKESRAQIINLVHDLILREDREKDQRERTTDIVRALRSEDARKTHEIERLAAKGEESARAAAAAHVAEQTAQAEVKNLEKALKALQDQTNKLKTTLAQVKTQCTNDVRKRDLELTRLKTHLQGQQRGSKIGMAAPSMQVRKGSEKKSTADLSIHDAEYSLKQETTEFLTQLSQSLSDENDGLISLLRSSLNTLKDLLGLPAQPLRHPDSAVGSMGSDHEVMGKTSKNNALIQALPTSHEVMAGEMAIALDHLKSLLTNPNFVSVEEVEVREEEIGRLRQGWEHMEQRWRDVLHMMESWRKRIDTGEMINIDDLRRGIGLVSPGRDNLNFARAPPPEQSFVDSEVSEIQLPDVSSIDDSSMIAASAAAAKPQLLPANGKPKRKRDVLDPPEFFDLRPPGKQSLPTPPSTVDVALLIDEADEESEELEVPQMTIEEKLTAAEEEASKAVRQRSLAVPTAESKIPTLSQRASHNSSRTTAASPVRKLAAREDDTLGKMPSPMAKRTKIRGLPRKRKSTLTPDELQALISTNGD